MNPGQKTLGRPLSRLLIASAIAATFPAYANDATEIEKLKAQIEELDQKLGVTPESLSHLAEGRLNRVDCGVRVRVALVFVESLLKVAK